MKNIKPSFLKASRNGLESSIVCIYTSIIIVVFFTCFLSIMKYRFNCKCFCAHVSFAQYRTIALKYYTQTSNKLDKTALTYEMYILINSGISGKSAETVRVNSHSVLLAKTASCLKKLSVSVNDLFIMREAPSI